MKRILLILIPALLFSVSVQAKLKLPSSELKLPSSELKQPSLFPNRSAKFDPSKLTYGGNFGATFGSLTYIDISPLVGYRITDRFISGIGLSYIYYRQKYSPTVIYQTHLYGGRLFSQYSILPNVFLHGELEALNFDYYDFLTGENTRAWSISPLAGAGYSSPIGNRGSFRIMALYAFSHTNPKSFYYGQPLIFRVGVFL